MRRWVALLFVLVLCAAACDRDSSRVARTTTTRTNVPSCVVATHPTTPRVPADVTRWAGGAPVIGSGALWTIASALRVPAVHDLGEWRIKFPWFTRPAGDDVPTISGRRLDGHGRFRAEANRAYDGTGRWVASSLTFSAPGCWEVTGRYRASTLTFRLRVAAAG